MSQEDKAFIPAQRASRQCASCIDVILGADLKISASILNRGLDRGLDLKSRASNSSQNPSWRIISMYAR